MAGLRLHRHQDRQGRGHTGRRKPARDPTPIWFVLDDGDLLFTTHAESVKGKALRRDPRISIAVDDQTPPYSYVLIQGEATLSEDLDEMLKWATIIGGRYMGADRAEEYGRRNAVAGEYLVRVRNTKVIAEHDVAS